MSVQSVVELRARAAQYREMAKAAMTEAMVNGLLRLATRFEELARQQELWDANAGTITRDPPY
jgi:hypothetical protein